MNIFIIKYLQFDKNWYNTSHKLHYVKYYRYLEMNTPNACLLTISNKKIFWYILL